MDNVYLLYVGEHNLLAGVFSTVEKAEHFRDNVIDEPPEDCIIEHQYIDPGF